MSSVEAFELIVTKVRKGELPAKSANDLLSDIFKVGFTFNVQTDKPTIQFTSKIDPIPIAESILKLG